LWDKIEQNKFKDSNLVWCVMGDFNALRYPNYRKWLGNGTDNRVEMKKFNEFINNFHLYDILAMGRRYTWYRPNEASKSRLN